MNDWPTNPREIAERIVEVSLKLVANGYEPVPLATKKAGSGWTNMEITPELIRAKYGKAISFKIDVHEEIARAEAALANGGREVAADGTSQLAPFWRGRDGGLWRREQANGVGARVRGFCSTDADVDDAAMQEMISDIFKKRLGQTWYDQHLRRFGNGAKVMFISGISSNAPVAATTKLVRPGDDPAAPGVKTHRIEVFPGIIGEGSKAPIRQVGLYGVCGPDAIYRYDDGYGPLEIPRADLVPMDREKLIAALAEIEAEMRAAGWVERVLPPCKKATPKAERRLPRGHLAQLGYGPGDRLSADDLRVDWLDGTNRSRLKVVESASGSLGVRDFDDDGHTYWEGPPPLDELTEIVAGKVAAKAETLAKLRAKVKSAEVVSAPEPANDNVSPDDVARVEQDPAYAALAQKLFADMKDPFRKKLGDRLRGSLAGLREPITGTKYDASLAQLMSARGYREHEIVLALWEFSPCGIVRERGQTEGARKRIEQLAADAVGRRKRVA
jgi:hypothetical protein